MHQQIPKEKFKACTRLHTAQVFVKTIQGTHTVVDVANSDAIRAIKTKVEEKQGIPIFEQRLVLDGKQLDDSQTIADYDALGDATCHLLLSLRGGTTIEELVVMILEENATYSISEIASRVGISDSEAREVLIGLVDHEVVGVRAWQILLVGDYQNLPGIKSASPSNQISKQRRYHPYARNTPISGSTAGLRFSSHAHNVPQSDSLPYYANSSVITPNYDNSSFFSYQCYCPQCVQRTPPPDIRTRYYPQPNQTPPTRTYENSMQANVSEVPEPIVVPNPLILRPKYEHQPSTRSRTLRSSIPPISHHLRALRSPSSPSSPSKLPSPHSPPLSPHTSPHKPHPSSPSANFSLDLPAFVSASTTTTTTATVPTLPRARSPSPVPSVILDNKPRKKNYENQKIAGKEEESWNEEEGDSDTDGSPIRWVQGP